MKGKEVRISDKHFNLSGIYLRQLQEGYDPIETPIT